MKITKYLVIAVIILLGVIGFTFTKCNKYKNQYFEQTVNYKAAMLERDSIKDIAIIYELSISDLNYMTDSITQHLRSVQNELKIKDKNIAALQYKLSNIKSVDTIYVGSRDTIFKEPSFKLDTLVGDKWHTIDLHMQYPNEVIISPSFVSELSLITEDKRETVDPPKKFFLWRWFQKKHTVQYIHVNESNPYIETKEQRFINIKD